MGQLELDLAAFRRIADALPTPMWALSVDGSIVWVNRAASELVGLSAESLGADNWPTVHPDDAPSVRAQLDEALASGVRFNYEHRIRRADGIYRWMGVEGGPIRDADGTVSEWIGITVDIETSKQAMMLLDALFSQAPVGLAYLDRDGRYVRINQTLATFNGLAMEAHEGRLASEIVPSLWPRVEPAFTHALQQGEAVLNREIVGETAATGGEIRHWLVSYYPVRTGREVTGVGVVAIDETGRRRAEIEMARLAEERRNLLAAVVRGQERERRTVAANIHADTLQVFAAVRLKLEELGESIADPAQHAAVEQVEAALSAAQERLRNLMFELWPPSLERSGLQLTIDELLTRLQEDVGVRTELEFNLGAEPSPELRGTLFRVIAEALANVRHHARAGSVKVTLTQQDSQLTLRVIDDGVGFDPASTPNLGHVGLLEMRERIRAVGGELRINSAPGEGTVIEGAIPHSADGD
ncbi:MAG TPA: PAS domain-containing protein [Solirubrobacteraceae bacterium]|nr:PAS domain-containing protein [Solirubrobacteraceae bacterium]